MFCVWVKKKARLKSENGREIKVLQEESEEERKAHGFGGKNELERVKESERERERERESTCDLFTHVDVDEE